jgi:hypothetical protein
VGLLTNLIEQKIEAKHRDEEQRKQKLREFYYDRIHDDQTPPDVREQLSQDYFKLLSPEAKKSAQKGIGLLGKLKQAVGGGGGQQTQQPSPNGTLATPQPMQQAQQAEQTQQAQPQQPRYPGQPAAPVQASTSAQAQPKGAQLSAPPPIQSQPGLPSHMFTTAQEQEKQKIDFATQEGRAAQAQKTESEQQEFDAWKKRGTDLGLTGGDLAEYAGSKGARLPPQQKRVVEKQVGRPGEDPATGKAYEGLWDHTVDPDRTETWAPHPTPPPKGSSSGMIRSVPHSVSVQDAQATAKSGAVYKDQNGEDIDLDKLPPNMGLQAMVVGDKMFWVPISPTQAELTVGNEKYVVTPYNKDVAHGAGVAQGQARTGTTSTPTQVVTQPNGQITALGSTSTPNTPGARVPGRPPAANGAGGGAKGLAGVTVELYNQSLQRVTPVRQAATQIFGDPSQPDLKGLKDFANVADNKESRDRLGKALRLTFTSLDQATGGANIAAGAGPVSLSTGGLGTLLQNAFSVPQKVAEQQAQIMQDAIKDLTPEEREAYDATMSAFGTIVGLRSLTKASAAQASVATIEREMPVIGVNTTSSSQFYDQLQRLAEIVYNGTQGLPAGMLDPKMVERLKNLPSDMQKRKQGASASPSGKLATPSSSPKTTHYVDSKTGDQWDIPADKEAAFKKAHPNAKAQ